MPRHCERLRRRPDAEAVSRKIQKELLRVRDVGWSVRALAPWWVLTDARLKTGR
jgi:hypothetical protein